ncbi:MAG: tyrosine-type recombinase/integrase [Bacteroidales bacterium]|jgi:integrase|nr:tyrosine-type recombinase/integrase [Bacteroidales bacterium]
MNEPLLTDFINYLLNEKKLAESTVNSTRNAAIKALKYAKKKKLIPNLDFEEIPRAGDISKERGVLTRKEVDALFGLEWPSIRSRIASLIAAYTGMRMGEIRSLRVCDIHSGYIDVKHGWGKKRGRKETKNQEVRQIPILPKVSAEIQGYIQQRGLKEPGDLLLPGKNPLVPYNNRQIGKDFNKMLEKIGIDDKTRKERGIVFHSWRHRMAKTLAENNTPKDIGKKILGHKTDRMYDHYASHCNDETLKIEEKYINLAFRQDMPEKEVPPLHGAV